MVLFCLFVLFWAYFTACGLLVPSPGIKPVCPALEAQRELRVLTWLYSVISLRGRLHSQACLSPSSGPRNRPTWILGTSWLLVSLSEYSQQKHTDFRHKSTCQLHPGQMSWSCLSYPVSCLVSHCLQLQTHVIGGLLGLNWTMYALPSVQSLAQKTCFQHQFSSPSLSFLGSWPSRKILKVGSGSFPPATEKVNTLWDICLWWGQVSIDVQLLKGYGKPSPSSGVREGWAHVREEVYCVQKTLYTPSIFDKARVCGVLGWPTLLCGYQLSCIWCDRPESDVLGE